MSFLSFFRSQSSGILTRLININSEIKIIRSDLERLLIMEQNLAAQELTDTQYTALVKNAVHNFGVAFWIKDETHSLLYSNKICDEKILSWLKNNNNSDELIKTKLITMRFIEHTEHEGKKVFVDTTKSPILIDEKFVGTIGSAVDITNHIPFEVRKQKRKVTCISIPMDAAIGSRKLIVLLERMR